MSAVVLPSPTGYVVWCPTCPSEREYPSELVAERAAFEHERSDQQAAETQELLARARARPVAPLHLRHSAMCTQEVCGTVLYFCSGPICHVSGSAGVACEGHPVKTRAELVARSSERYRKR